MRGGPGRRAFPAAITERETRIEGGGDFQCQTGSQEGWSLFLKEAVDTQMTKQSNTTGHPRQS